LFRNGLADSTPPRPRLSVISSEEFASTRYKRDWLVEGVLVEGQPAVWGGPKKALKNSTQVDLCVALGTPVEYGPGLFLGHFKVPKPRRIAIFSGESGEHKLQETALRVALSRGLDLAKLHIHWGFTLPRVTCESDLEEIRGLIERHRFEVVIIDPLYLSLPGRRVRDRHEEPVLDGAGAPRVRPGLSRPRVHPDPRPPRQEGW
jgi:hypothetical protein